MGFFKRILILGAAQTLIVLPLFVVAVKSESLWLMGAVFCGWMIFTLWGNWFVYGGYRDRQRAQEALDALAKDR